MDGAVLNGQGRINLEPYASAKTFVQLGPYIADCA